MRLIDADELKLEIFEIDEGDNMDIYTNEVIDIIEGTPMDNEYRFCPWCGAKMEGAEE